MGFAVRSSAFQDGQPIPAQYTGEAEDISPPLEWSGVPEGTQQFAIICRDPDAPASTPWVHWVLYGLPSDVRELPAGIPPQERLATPAGAVQGKNSWTADQTIGYRGPMPPRDDGVHHYEFVVFALDTQFDFQPGLECRTLVSALTGHVLAEAKLIGTFER